MVKKVLASDKVYLIIRTSLHINWPRKENQDAFNIHGVLLVHRNVLLSPNVLQ